MLIRPYRLFVEDQIHRRSYFWRLATIINFELDTELFFHLLTERQEHPGTNRTSLHQMEISIPPLWFVLIRSSSSNKRTPLQIDFPRWSVLPTRLSVFYRFVQIFMHSSSATMPLS